MGSAAMDALKYSNYMSGLYGSMANSRGSTLGENGSVDSILVDLSKPNFYDFRS